MTRKQFLKTSALMAMAGTLPSCVAKSTAFPDIEAESQQQRSLRIKKSKHFSGDTFENIIKTNTGVIPGKRLEALRKLFTSDNETVPTKPFPIVQLNKADFTSCTELSAVWMGHATLIIEIDGKRFLTDPVWSERPSPVSFIGPKRFHPLPLAIDSLPKLDGILISHNHRDHLDEPSIRALLKKDVPFFVPLGVGKHLQEWGVPCHQIIEKDWGEEHKSSDGSFTCTAAPARHFSGRIIFDDCETLWTSWIITGKSHRVFFCGDTGMFPHFKDMGHQYGPFDMTILPIGAYDSCWPDIHLTPEQAIEAHEMLNGDILIPIHWGTFNLAPHAWFDPPQRLLQHTRDRLTRYVLPKPGQRISVNKLPPVENWWM